MSDKYQMYQKIPLLGAIFTGGLASACCIGPLVFFILGLGSASVFITLEPLRPFFAVLTLGLLGWAVLQYWKGRKACLNQGRKPVNPMLLILLACIAIVLLMSPSLLAYMIPQGGRI